MIEYAYRVIRVLEESRQYVIDNELVGLYPLLPLMKRESPNEKPEEVLQQSIAIIQQVKDKSLQLDLLATMAVLVSHKYPVTLVLSMIGREMIMESPVYQEWVKEERMEAEARGEARGIGKGMTESICKILSKRFGPKSFKLQDIVNSISSKVVLDWIFEEVIDVTDLKTAKRIIEEATEQE